MMSYGTDERKFLLVPLHLLLAIHAIHLFVRSSLTSFGLPLFRIPPFTTGFLLFLAPLQIVSVLLL